VGSYPDRATRSTSLMPFFRTRTKPVEMTFTSSKIFPSVFGIRFRLKNWDGQGVGRTKNRFFSAVPVLSQPKVGNVPGQHPKVRWEKTPYDKSAALR
jgi:hypothetical protein